MKETYSQRWSTAEPTGVIVKQGNRRFSQGASLPSRARLLRTPRRGAPARTCARQRRVIGLARPSRLPEPLAAVAQAQAREERVVPGARLQRRQRRQVAGVGHGGRRARHGLTSQPPQGHPGMEGCRSARARASEGQSTRQAAESSRRGALCFGAAPLSLGPACPPAPCENSGRPLGLARAAPTQARRAPGERVLLNSSSCPQWRPA